MDSDASWSGRLRIAFYAAAPAFALSLSSPGTSSPRFFGPILAVVFTLLAGYFRVEADDRRSPGFPIVRFSIASSLSALLVLELLTVDRFRQLDDPFRPVLVLAAFTATLGLVLLASDRPPSRTVDDTRTLPGLRSAVATGVAVLLFALGATTVVVPPDPFVQLASLAVLCVAAIPLYAFLVLPSYGIEAGTWALGYGVVLYLAQVLVVLPLAIAVPPVRHLVPTAVLVVVASAFFANRAEAGAAARERAIAAFERARRE